MEVKGCPASRWSEAFDVIRARDTVDTIDTMPRVGALGPHTGNSVNCVNQGKEAKAAVTAAAAGNSFEHPTQSRMSGGGH
jgi:hypothetical protein